MADFDNMTPKEVREWGKNLAWHASQFGEIRATLIVNCQTGRRLNDLGIDYDERSSVLTNLVVILEKLAVLAEAK